MVKKQGGLSRRGASSSAHDVPESSAKGAT